MASARDRAEWAEQLVRSLEHHHYAVREADNQSDSRNSAILWHPGSLLVDRA